MDVSPEQIERSRRTIQAARVFADNSEAIVAHVGELPEDHVVVAVVTADHEFAGVHHVSRLELVERVPELEGPSGWAMVFSSGTDHAHVAARTEEMISLADKRIEMISRIAGRRSNSD
jgi:hypothetical protein